MFYFYSEESAQGSGASKKALKKQAKQAKKDERKANVAAKLVSKKALILILHVLLVSTRV